MMITTRLLVNGKENFTPEHVVIIGAGVIENAWDPLKQLIFKTTDQRLIGKGFGPEEPLAYLVYLARVVFKDLREATIQKRLNFSIFTKLVQQRNDVAQAYQAAMNDNTISFRGKPNQHLETLLSSESTGIITTNWETLLEKQYPNKQILYLHGNINYPETLIFPTEIALDSYRKLPLTADSHNCHRDITGAHLLCINWLKAAKTVTIWGLSLHPYDAELATVIAEIQKADESNPKKYYVVDLSKLPYHRMSYLTSEDQTTFLKLKKDRQT